MTQLILKVKQGEELSKDFTLKADGVAMNLTGATIVVEAKKAPYASQIPIFTKTITETSNEETIGKITYPLQGKFVLRLLTADTSFAPNDYYLVIRLDLNNQKDIISSSDCSNAIYRICTQ